MLKLTYEDLTRTRPQYLPLNRASKPEQPSGQCPYKVYSYTEASMVPMYDLAGHSGAEINSFYSTLMSPDFKEMTEENFLKFVTIALSVKNPLNLTETLIKIPPPGSCDPEYKTRAPNKKSKVEFVSSTTGHETIQVLPNQTSQSMETDDSETADDKALAICFAFAWATRYCVKSPGTALSIQLRAMKSTYLKFYRRSSSLLSKFNPSKEWLEGIQTCFNSFPTVRHTMAICVAITETSLKGKSVEFNVARYLYFQNLEFMGMHAYVSCVKITNKVAVQAGIVLSWLRMQGVENAVDEIAMIMDKLDNGMIPNGATSERLWKYARLIDEGYFNKMQSTYSPDLIAVLAYIEIKLGMANETGYNSPLNIYSLKNNKHLMERGEAKASIFMDLIGSMSLNDPNASLIDRIDASKQGKLNLSNGASTATTQPKKRTHSEALETEGPSSGQGSVEKETEGGGVAQLPPPIFLRRK